MAALPSPLMPCTAIMRTGGVQWTQEEVHSVDAITLWLAYSDPNATHCIVWKWRNAVRCIIPLGAIVSGHQHHNGTLLAHLHRLRTLVRSFLGSIGMASTH